MYKNWYCIPCFLNEKLPISNSVKLADDDVCGCCSSSTDTIMYKTWYCRPCFLNGKIPISNSVKFSGCRKEILDQSAYTTVLVPAVADAAAVETKATIAKATVESEHLL